MKKIVLFWSCLLATCWLVACGATEEGGGDDDDDNDATVADTAATGALDATGDAYLASLDDAEAVVGALFQALSVSAGIEPTIKNVSFEGNEDGAAGTVSWNGQIDETDTLNLDYTLTFADYQALAGGVAIDGAFSISVSEGADNCTGAWNIADLDVTSGTSQVTLDSTGAGLTLSGSNCESMTLDGSLDVSGDVTADCDVSGGITSPTVACN